MEPLISLAAFAFTLAWVGYGVKCLMDWRARRDTIRQVDPGRVESLEKWNREWSHPDTGGFYRWDSIREKYKEAEESPRRDAQEFTPPPGEAVTVEEFIPSLGSSVRYVEYQGRRYSLEEFNRKFS